MVIYDHVRVNLPKNQEKEHTVLEVPTVKFILLFIVKPNVRAIPAVGPIVKRGGICDKYKNKYQRLEDFWVLESHSSHWMELMAPGSN